MTESTISAAPALPAVRAAFNPAEVEGPLYERWVERGYFNADETSDRPPFCIVIPPPNVTGSLHLGHAFEHTLMDACVRRRRMQGYEALWMPGMDHAGIATQNLVEKQLVAEGTDRHELGREQFIERVWQWKAESGGQILGQMRRLGDGVDWRRERFTMDDGLSRAVHTMFKRLFDDGLIYRANRMVNWSPALESAISDIEVDYRDVDGELVSVRYGDGADSVVVATTRVETMLGDTAVAVHPDDTRYSHLVGRQVELPLTGRSIPVIADPHVDPEFGTGVVKVTPAHDTNDFLIGQRHDLPMPVVLDSAGVVTGSGTAFDGLDRAEARIAVREALREQGRLVAEKRPYVHSVGHCSRSGVPIEPLLSEQWFVDVGPLAKAAGDAVRDGRVRIHPVEMESRWFEWVDNMHDWCISRQLWWGHRIPVWHGPEGQLVCVGPGEAPPSGPGWVQDPDVLDTWFSSGLWPFSTLGWPEQSASLAKFYPTQVMITGYDILFFWVARMMMFGLYAFSDAAPEDAVPFRVIALHGMVRDDRGRKMSKSAGNVVDPMDWMNAYGSDALRFALARGANPGVDVPIAEEWVQGARNFCNKLWNATRFALTKGARVGELPEPAALSAPDRWILSRLHTVVAQVDAFYEDFQFAKACEALYHFAWDELCDWYLELVKPALADDDRPDAPARLVLGHALDVVLRLLHPVSPFVTEALWSSLTGEESVVITDWPQAQPQWHDPSAEAEIETVQQLVTQIRRFRSDQGLAPKQKVGARLSAPVGGTIAHHEAQVRSLTGLTPDTVEFSPTARLQVGDVQVELDTSGAIDLEAERKRLDKDLAAARKELDQATAKLDNEQFLAKAPVAVVEKIRDRRAQAEADIATTETALAQLAERERSASGPGDLE